MRADIHAAVERTAHGIADSAGAGVELEINAGPPPVINDPELVARMRPTLERVTTVNDVNPQTVAEDFSIYANEIPGMFIFLGSGPPGVDPATLPSNHSPLFDMHEPSMETGVRVFSHLVVDYLQGE
jgi:amidohydrolase